MSDVLFLSLLVGFIDGDGCIRKQTNRNDCFIQLKGHSAWLSLFQAFEVRLNTIYNSTTNSAKINNAGYAYFGISNSKALELKKVIEYNQLPVLNRKWNKLV